jgi:hypothetical protein
MLSAPRKYVACTILSAFAVFEGAHSAMAQMIPFGGGPFGGGMVSPRMSGMGFNPNNGMVGNGGRRSNGGLVGQLLQGGGNSYGGNRMGPMTMQPNPNQGVAGNYFVDPNTGQVIQVAPGINAGQVQQPVMTQTRVYDTATNRIFIQETNQFTGEMWDPVNQRAYWPTQTAATTPASPAATAPAPGVDAKPAEPPKPVGPPRNILIAKLKAAPEIVRKQVRNLIRMTAYENFLSDEVEAALHGALFSDVDRERLLGLAQRKESVTPEKFEILTNAVDQLDAPTVRLKLDAIDVARGEYAGMTDKMALSKVYREIGDAGLQTPSKTRQLVSRLIGAATKAGVSRDALKAVTQKIEAFSRINEELDGAEVEGEGLDLASVTPETVFTVVRCRGIAANGPALLASATLLLPASGKGTGANKLTIETATARELGLPIYGSLNQPIAEASTDAPASSVGVTFRVDPQAAADVTIYVTDPDEKLAHPHTLKPGASFPFADRKSVQIAIADARGALSAWETIGSGSYILSQQGGNWQKTTEPSAVVIDNSANVNPFSFSIGGVDGTVPARQVVAYNCPTPATPIKFHRGLGDSIANKVLSGKDRRFVVRVAPDGGLDLFDPEALVPDDATAIADARPTAADAGLAPKGAMPRSASRPEGVLENIRPRFPVGTLDE